MARWFAPVLVIAAVASLVYLCADHDALAAGISIVVGLVISRVMIRTNRTKRETHWLP